MTHAPGCRWEKGGAPCRQFSTDGTALGAEIAHTMGTTDEKEITARAGSDAKKIIEAALTGVPEEQADWDAVE